MPSLLLFLGLNHKVLPKPFVAGKWCTPVHSPIAQKTEVGGSLEPRNESQTGQLNITLNESCKDVPPQASAGKQLLFWRAKYLKPFKNYKQQNLNSKILHEMKLSRTGL